MTVEIEYGLDESEPEAFVADGDSWIGSAWIGDAWIGGIGPLTETMRDRLLHSVRNGPRFSGLITVFADRTERIATVAAQVREAFDLDNAVGVQLDRLGEILQLRRLGASDERYRVLLKIQVQLILSSTGTSGVLAEVVRLFTGVEPTEYYEHHPMRITIGARLENTADAPVLRSLLEKGKPGGVALTLAVETGDTPLVWDEGNWDEAHWGWTEF